MADQLYALFTPLLVMSNDISPSTKLAITALVMFTSALLKYLSDNDHIRLDHLYSRFFSKKSKSYILKARICFKNNLVYDSDIPQSFIAIQNKLYSTITKDTGTHLDYTIDEHVINDTCHKFVCIKTKYEIETGIMVTQHMDTKWLEKDEYCYHTYTFEITSKTGVFANVITFINSCTLEHDTEVSKIDQKIWILSDFSTHQKTQLPYYTSIPFDGCTKTFNNMFFKDKVTLLKQIDEFENGQDTYTKLGMPYTQGMFFHGLYGTGKTSCAKAIAHYTKRHVVLVSLGKVKTARQFSNLFMDPYMNGIKIPINNRLYIFDDFDCKAWANVVKKRVPGPVCNNTNNTSSDLLKVAMALAASKGSKKKDRRDYDDDSLTGDTPIDECITLGDVLEILDGFVEMSGRQIIFTSNHIESLDPALLRKGRIDIMIEFRNMRKQDVNDMYKLWFDMPIPEAVYGKMKDEAFSQADLGNLFKTMDMNAINKALAYGTV